MSGDTLVDPAIIRSVLEHADTNGVAVAALAAGFSRRAIYSWRRRRTALGSNWPTDADIAAWQEKAVARAEDRARKRHQMRNYRRSRYLTGKLHIDPTGTRRRLRALFAIGYTARSLGGPLRVSPSRVSQIANGYWDQVHVDTAERVKVLFDRLCMTRPVGPVAERQRKLAARKGWPSALAWDDDTIDDPKARPQGMQKPTSRHRDEVDEAAVIRAMGGDRGVTLTKAERAEVVRRLRAAGWPVKRIEEHTGLKPDRYITRTTVERAA